MSTIKTGSLINAGTREYKVVGMRKLLDYGKFWTNQGIEAELSLVGKRGATYSAYLYKSGRVEILSDDGSQPSRFNGNFGYYGSTGTIVNLEIV